LVLTAIYRFIAWSRDNDYVAMKKAMGFSFYDQEIRLRDFSRFLEGRAKECITLELAKEWALGGATCPDWLSAKKLSVLRAFAVYWQTIEPRTELWPEHYWRMRYQRKNPYIYRDEEILCLLRATRRLGGGEGLRPRTFYTFFGLVAATGLRLTEALSLLEGDVDLAGGRVTIRRAKFNKMRVIPIHESTRRRLKRYAALRDAHCKEAGIKRGPSSRFFVTEEGKAIATGVVQWTFDKLMMKCEIRTESRRGPRIHDLRHTFIVRTIEEWYRRGENVEALLPVLSTYVGHAQPGSTYWYITITPELMGLASERLDRYMGGLSQ
jgi:integrase